MGGVVKEKVLRDWVVEAREGGIYLPQLDLWMDPKRPQRRAVVTHAHYDHLAGHREIWASSGTARLLQERVPKRTKIRAIPFGKAVALGGWSPFHPCSGGAYFRFGDGVGEKAGRGEGDAITLYGRF